MNKKRILIFIGIILACIISLISSYFYLYKEDEIITDSISYQEPTTTTRNLENEKRNFYVDVKGAVKKPGVYEVNDGMMVIDAIKMAGGLKNNAYTSNINLSQKLTESMVIYIFTKTEMKTEPTSEIITNTTCTTQIINVDTPTTIENKPINTTSTTTSTSIKNTTSTLSTSSKLINLNTATETELTTLPGIGVSKAKTIIEYRTANPFNKIEDIKNVSGIGDAAFEKIKDYITV